MSHCTIRSNVVPGCRGLVVLALLALTPLVALAEHEGKLQIETAKFLAPIIRQRHRK